MSNFTENLQKELMDFIKINLNVKIKLKKKHKWQTHHYFPDKFECVHCFIVVDRDSASKIPNKLCKNRN